MTVAGTLAHVHHQCANAIQNEVPFEAKRSVWLVWKAKASKREYDTQLRGPERSPAKVNGLMLQSLHI
jgi:hypothetical protein